MNNEFEETSKKMRNEFEKTLKEKNQVLIIVFGFVIVFSKIL